MWIDRKEIAIDDVDGEPLCVKCGPNLASRGRDDEIAVCCSNGIYPNKRRPIIIANDYGEILTALLWLIPLN